MLPGRRRLQQGRRDDASSSSTPGRRDPPSSAALAALPPYKAQACALNSEGVDHLFQLVQNLKTEKLDEHVRESLSLIGRATFELNETLQTARSNLEGLSENKEEERARMQKKVTKLELLAKSLTTEAEQSVRQLVDLKAGVADEREVLRATHDATSTVARTRQQERMRREQRQQELAEAGEADEDGRDVLAEPLFHPSTDMIRELREQKASDYESMAAYQRYSLNNDYIEFKRQWHMGLHGADAIVPDAKRWFTHAGEPVFNYGTSGENGGDEDEEMADGDDDIVIERQKVSTRCPLSLQEMREPYTNSRCKHTFEKDAILEFFGGAQRVRCPQAGCNMDISKRDLHPDRAMLARIRRAQRERQRPESEDEDEDNSRMVRDDGDGDDDEEGDESDEEGGGNVATRIKEESRNSARPRRSVKRERGSRAHEYDEL